MIVGFWPPAWFGPGCTLLESLVLVHECFPPAKSISIVSQCMQELFILGCKLIFEWRQRNMKQYLIRRKLRKIWSSTWASRCVDVSNSYKRSDRSLLKFRWYSDPSSMKEYRDNETWMEFQMMHSLYKWCTRLDWVGPVDLGSSEKTVNIVKRRSKHTIQQ